MKRLLLVTALILSFSLGLYAQADTKSSTDHAAPRFQGARLVQVAHRRHAHRAGHHHHARRRAHPRRA
jgi:hypothetical protein